MKDDNWQKLEQAYHHASQLAPKQLASYIEQLQNSEPEIAEELGELLEQNSQQVLKPNTNKNQVSPDSPANNQQKKSNIDTLIGSEIGPFKLVEKIADGGMSAVYKAERISSDFKQHAAIKIVTKQFLSPDSLANFNFERRTLASFDHPNIAKVLDGGTTKSGLPYLAMEYIEGVPIDQFCVQRELSLQQVIKLFIQLAEAVEYAHKRLVVHRDIKPSNVLVTTDGLVKLLDFGISKSMELERQNDQATTLGSRPMTPAFASPEQISGQPITIATDIYSLGVLLYKLLTKKMPYANTSSLQLIYSICKEQPSSPSQTIYSTWKEQTTTHKTSKPNREKANQNILKRLHRSIKGDLDNIVLYSLNKKPEARYNSVRDFSNDLNRYLNGEAVLARGDSQLYKLKKWVLRNKAVSVLACTLLVSYSGFTSYSIWQANQLSIESRTAQTVSDYLVNLFTVVNINKPQTEIKPNKEMTVIELLDAGREFIIQDLKDQPEVKVRLLNSMADAYQGMGDYKNAEALIDETIQLQQSLDISDIQLADSFNISGWNKYSSGKYRQALLLFSKALTLDIDKATYYQSLQNVATAQTALAEFEKAKQNYEKVIEYNNSLPKQNEAKNAAALHNYAILLWELAEYKKAKEIELKVLDIFVRNYGENSSHASDAYNFLGTLSKLIDNDITSALEYYQKSLAIDRSLYPGQHQSIGYGLLDIGSLYFELRDYQQALKSFEEARDIFISLFGMDNLEVGNALNSIADVYFDFGEIKKAKELYQQALDIYDKSNPAINPSKSIVIQNLAQSEFELFERQSSVQTIATTLDSLLSILPPKHPQIRSLRSTLIGFNLRMGEVNLAKEQLSQLNPSLINKLTDPDKLSTEEISLALIYWQSTGEREIENSYLNALNARLRSKGLVNFSILNNLINYGERLVNSRRVNELEPLLPEMARFLEVLKLESSLLSLKYHLLVSQYQLATGNHDAAYSAKQRAQEISAKLGFELGFVERLVQQINENNPNN